MYIKLLCGLSIVSLCYGITVSPIRYNTQTNVRERSVPITQYQNGYEHMQAKRRDIIKIVDPPQFHGKRSGFVPVEPKREVSRSIPIPQRPPRRHMNNNRTRPFQIDLKERQYREQQAFFNRPIATEYNRNTYNLDPRPQQQRPKQQIYQSRRPQPQEEEERRQPESQEEIRPQPPINQSRRPQPQEEQERRQPEHEEEVRPQQQRPKQPINQSRRPQPQEEQEKRKPESHQEEIRPQPPINQSRRPQPQQEEEDDEEEEEKSSEENQNEERHVMHYVSVPNYIPAKPPTFSSVRHQVELLKERQKNYFASQEQEEPTDLGKEENSEESDTDGHEIYNEGKKIFDDQKNYDKQSEEEEEPNKYSEEDFGQNDRSDDEDEEEFIPIQMLAQLRHSETTKVVPRLEEEPRIKEKVQLQKSHTLYSEQGYDDEKYDHGKESKFAAVKNNKRGSIKFGRTKREAVPVISEENIDEIESIEEIGQLPEALALINGTTLNGQEILRHLSEVIENSTRYLPDDDKNDKFVPYVINATDIKKLFNLQRINIAVPKYSDEETSESIKTESKFSKYPYYNLPPNVLSQMSALRYAGNAKNVPNPKGSYYETKTDIKCEEINPDVDPNEDYIKNGNADGKKKKLLKNLGQKIGCYKQQYFGKNPFDNPIFNEEYVGIPDPIFKLKSTNDAAVKPDVKVQTTYSPSFNVYDDVLTNIRATIVAETVNQSIRNKLAYLNLQKKYSIGADPETSESTDNKKVASIVEPPYDPSEVPIFDISKFIPKTYMIRSDGKLYKIKYKKRGLKKKLLKEKVAEVTTISPPPQTKSHPKENKINGIIVNSRYSNNNRLNTNSDSVSSSSQKFYNPQRKPYDYDNSLFPRQPTNENSNKRTFNEKSNTHRQVPSQRRKYHYETIIFT